MRNILGLVTQRTGRVIAEPIAVGGDPEAVAWLTAHRESPAILETLQFAAIAGRFSIFAADPVRIFACGPAEDDPIAGFIRHVKAGQIVAPQPCDIPFVAGWIGHISYEAGVPGRLVQKRRNQGHTPLLQFGLYDHALVFDHATGQWWATAVEWPDIQPKGATAAEKIQSLHRRLESARSVGLPALSDAVCSTVSLAMTRAQYKAKVRRIKEYIEAGDIYQANLAQRFRVKTDVTPFDLYRRVRRTNPAAYAAFLSRDDHAIVSASPELFLDLRDGHAITRPIKGTRPRSGVDAIDAAGRRELCTSQKDVSELNMIIDLLRNDLGRACEIGSIRVTDSGTIEEHPTVFHRVATIEGRLGPGKDWSDLLEATFPGGSIVGAPKIRAMQIIRELEPFARGPYCGAIGWVGLDGNMTFNVAIRTMVRYGSTADVFAGSGIVAESDPESEYEETKAKASGLLASLDVRPGDELTKRRADLAIHE